MQQWLHLIMNRLTGTWKEFQILKHLYVNITEKE